jgi:HNH endonuclease
MENLCFDFAALSDRALIVEVKRLAASERRATARLDGLADGRLNLTTVRLLSPHLTAENHEDLLAKAQHRPKWEVEEIIAALAPRPDVGPRVIAVPAAARVSDLLPLSPEKVRIVFTISYSAHRKLRRLQDLMRHHVPDGDVGEILERAIDFLLVKVERTTWARDGGRCAFVGGEGRCRETGFLEFHHVIPFAAGGETCEQNLQLRCRAHNRCEAEQGFPLVMPEREE